MALGLVQSGCSCQKANPFVYNVQDALGSSHAKIVSCRTALRSKSQKFTKRNWNRVHFRKTTVDETKCTRRLQEKTPHSFLGTSLSLLQRINNSKENSKEKKQKKSIRGNSEFWYEEEEEFDVNEVIRPKRIVLVSTVEHDANMSGAPGSVLTQHGVKQAEETRMACKTYNFQAAFCGAEPAAQETADIMWEERKGPPYFRYIASAKSSLTTKMENCSLWRLVKSLSFQLPDMLHLRARKVRPRDALRGAESTNSPSKGGDANSESHPPAKATAFLEEVCSINWSMELTEGLGSGELDLTRDREDILVVAHPSAIEALVRLAVPEVTASPCWPLDPGSLSVLEYTGSRELPSQDVDDKSPDATFGFPNATSLKGEFFAAFLNVWPTRDFEMS